ncbi:MAG: molybdenum cofactor biosynthesis protein MoaE [Paracoccaceae bacterium]
MRIIVQQGSFDPGAELNAFSKGRSDIGAIVTFSGVVRDVIGDELRSMEIEHYPGMTEAALTKIASEAQARWDLGDLLVIHRHGRLEPCDVIMMVATAARHRKHAFEAAEYLMDYLKSRAPFWKKEYTKTDAGWVVSKTEDEDALKRW